MRSIRRRLLGALLAAIVVGLLVGAYGTYRMARQEATEIFDYHLRQLALSLRDHAFARAALPDDALAEDERDFLIQVWDARGAVLYQSDPRAALPRQAAAGFSTIETATGRWRLYVSHWQGRIIQVAHPRHVRDRLAITMALRLMLPILLVSPGLGLLIWWLVGRGLSPLGRLAAGVTRRAPGALQPLSLAGVPDEAMPLVEAINDLLARLDHALAAQRNFVADAAHELRTPLTALQLHVQLARRANDEAGRRVALDELRAGLERASHVVQQLLTLARQEPGAQEERPLVRVDLSAVTAQVVADHLRLAEQRDIDLGMPDSLPAAAVKGDPAAVRTLIANLVDNALRYTPPGGRVDAAIRQHADRVRLSIDDSGPGIPPDDRQRVFDRFYRRTGSDESGSGLGLAIVQAIAERHGATVVLGNSVLGGLQVTVDWPGLSQD